MVELFWLCGDPSCGQDETGVWAEGNYSLSILSGEDRFSLPAGAGMRSLSAIQATKPARAFTAWDFPVF